MVKAGLLYSESHEWVEKDGNVGIVGISDHAQHELGSVVFIDLPKVGKVIKKGDAVGAVESVKAASDLYTPISGKIIEINEALENEPEMLNDNPYGAWIFKVEISEPQELDKLLSPEAYKEIAEE
ncbi:MAG: glycine cleavage system protein H [Tenericutes bacterium HGW-Tenericutes-6]|jgi:glycine cleavage system H protein|nr:MAG: glycine cleavage system protein H [Tenericutes bacterium HGW-Tenericutes-6]